MSNPRLTRRAFLRTTIWLGTIAMVQYMSIAVSASASADAEATTYGAGAYGAGAYGVWALSASLVERTLTKEA
jgi:hypothetical protein